MDDLVTTCDEVTDSYDKEIKTVPTNFNEKNITCKTKFLYFTHLFVNYHFIIDSYQYMLLSD